MSYTSTPGSSGAPRSTPIPGSPAEPWDQPPPTPSQFLDGQPHDAGATIRTGVSDAPRPTAAPAAASSSGSSGSSGWFLRGFVGLVFLMIVGAVGAGVWATYRGVTSAKEATDRANDIADPSLSDGDLDALDLAEDEEFLFGGEAAEAVAEAMDAEILGEPTQFTEIAIYGDYAISTAQDPAVPGRLDRYIWRGGGVGAPDPQQDDPEAASAVFVIDEIDWAAISDVVDSAVDLAGVDGGSVDYLIVSRDVFVNVGDLVVRIYVNGPRASAVIETTADGVVTRVF